MAESQGRSRNYPAFGLPGAIDRARDLYQRDGKALVPAEVAVQAWGYGGLNGASLRVLAALKQYGLLEDPKAKHVKLSSRALTILLDPEDSTERAEAIKAAAREPAVFQELFAQYPDGIPSDAAMISHLVRNGGFHEGGAKAVITAFRDTIALVDASPVADISRTPRQETGGQSTERSRPDEAHGTHSAGERPLEFTWPLSGDSTARLTVSRSLEPDDIETLAAYFEIAKKALGKAARGSASAGHGPGSGE